MTLLRSELPFAALVTYSPRLQTADARRSRDLMLQVKENRVIKQKSGATTTASAFVARRMREIAPVFAAEFLGPHVALVPIPRSHLQRPDALWPAKEIADAVHGEGYGAGVLPCLTRETPVPKAATAAAKDRPKASAHCDSLKVAQPLELPSEVTLIDDVITRGAQLFGAACAIWRVRPNVVVRAFVVIRTMSEPAVFTRILDPCVGTVQLRGEACFRTP